MSLAAIDELLKIIIERRRSFDLQVRFRPRYFPISYVHLQIIHRKNVMRKVHDHGFHEQLDFESGNLNSILFFTFSCLVSCYDLFFSCLSHAPRIQSRQIKSRRNLQNASRPAIVTQCTSSSSLISDHCEMH